jgi:hypothetical protein
MFLPSLTELMASEGYRRYFTVVPALTADLRTRNYRLRHQVYCRELGFEPLRPDDLEYDEFDERSVHCLVQSAASGQRCHLARGAAGHFGCRGERGMRQSLPACHRARDSAPVATLRRQRHG